jgi:hypothetical protein
VKRGAASAQRGVWAATFNLKVSLTPGGGYFAVGALYAYWFTFASFLKDRVKNFNTSDLYTVRRSFGDSRERPFIAKRADQENVKRFILCNSKAEP